MALIYRNGRPYLYRSVRCSGRVTSEYRGSGECAVLIDRLDVIERDRAEADRHASKVEAERMAAEEAEIAAWFGRVEPLAEAAMVVAGFHRRKGQWRRRRGRTEQDTGGE
jgi:hypothetical protein